MQSTMVSSSSSSSSSTSSFFLFFCFFFHFLFLLLLRLLPILIFFFFFLSLNQLDFLCTIYRVAVASHHDESRRYNAHYKMWLVSGRSDRLQISPCRVGAISCEQSRNKRGTETDYNVVAKFYALCSVFRVRLQFRFLLVLLVPRETIRSTADHFLIYDLFPICSTTLG